MLAFGLTSPIISIYIFVMSALTLDYVNGFTACTLSIIGNQNDYEILMMVAKGASVISDGLVLILTCVKTLSSTRTMDSVNGKKDTLSSILLKDTATCFGDRTNH